MTLKEKYQLLSEVFEQENGAGTFLSMCIANLHSLLIKKGIVTKDELYEGLMHMMDIYNKQQGKLSIPESPIPPPLRDDGYL